MNEIDNVLKGGARWAVKQGYGWQQDLETIEAGGALEQADPDAVSPQAKQRGRGQVGTLGSGNHFLEVQVVDQIYDVNAASAMGIDHPGQVVLFVHCGSRGLGHQVCTDYLRTAERSAREHGINLVDRQLACMPFKSPEGQQYFGAMSAAANFAWANRQEIANRIRDAIARHTGIQSAGPGVQSPPAAVLRRHASHGMFLVPSGADAEGPCIIEPTVMCNHCCYCKSYGH
jgi:tRNA-splicing ligase RtcB